jgi:hypothetical protein
MKSRGYLCFSAPSNALSLFVCCLNDVEMVNKPKQIPARRNYGMKNGD